MQLLEELFRVQEDGFHFQAFSRLHIVLVLVMFLGAYWIYRKREDIRKNQDLDTWVRGVLIAMIVLHQVTFLYFSFFIRTDGLASGLPLYTCRMALWTALLALISKKEAFKGITIYWGLIGGILPMILPDLMAYSWPHITNFNYFLTHYSIFWASIYFLGVDQYQFNQDDLNFSLAFVNLFLVLCLFANKFFYTNYAYLSASPVLTTSLESMPRIFYYALVFLAYNLFIVLVHWIFINKEELVVKFSQWKEKKAA